MVGVPGKSKGCRTCRKRKIACDQGQPVCGQCLKSRRDCGGYEKPRIFLNNFADQFQPRKQYTVSSNTSDVEIQSGIAHVSNDVNTAWADGIFNVDRTTTAASATNLQQLRRVAQRIAVPRLIGPEHLQSDEALQTFLVCSLPHGAREEVPLAWLYSIMEISKDSPALPYAIAALSYGWVGNAEEAPQVVGKARSFYVGALHHLHKALSENPASQSDSMLATMECLALYEMFESGMESENAWLAHISGAEAIIRLRGPQNHVAGPAHKMFMFFRTIGVFKAIICRQPTFLSEGEWMNVPWTYNQKNTFHHYLDLAAEVPNLLQRSDGLASQLETEDREVVLDVLRDTASLIIRATSLFDKCGIKLPAGPPNISSPRLTLSTVPEPGPQFIYSSLARRQTSIPENQRRHYYPSKSPHDLGTSFDVLQSCRLVYGLWNVQLTLYLNIYENSTLKTCLEQSQASEPVFWILSRSHATNLADRIALWSDFCTQNAWQSFGPVLAMFHLQTAVRWYKLDKKHELDRLNAEKSVRLSTWPDPDVAVSYEMRYSRQAEIDKCLDLLAHMPSSEGLNVIT